MAFLIGKRQKAAVKLFFEGYNVRQVAARVGVHRATLWRWWQHPEMRKYAERYNTNQIRKTAEKVALDISSRLNSDDPWEANRTAARVLNVFIDWTMNG